MTLLKPDELKQPRPYGYRWQQAREGWLRKNPLCVRCLQSGLSKPANVVDHIQPHRGDMTLFWDRTNWQSLCTNCHSSYKQRLEKSGRELGCDVSGRPLDPRHHWNRPS
ncbi:HNH endonuclease [Pseudomonas monteilii]|uniref:Putative HNH nuclease YajD n=1 Tax=Pseudomonas monteilii TaxID=76759 RepID=A0A2N1IMB8_9PSED|nr:HNH endonuclease [Pseudomonas monteilii]PKI19397.1 HNH endonuclease [Pseudomonas monteilii]RPD91921.1 HNH endonuclease [Pseudomonas monteilii]